MKAGIPREAIKTTLVTAGWVAADVEDSLKKVEGALKPAAPAGMAPASAMPAAGGAMPSTRPAATPGSFSPSTMGTGMGGGPKAIKVSDLVSSVGAGAPGGAAKIGSLAAAGSAMGSMASAAKPLNLKTEKKPGGHVMTIVFVVIIVLLAGLSGYLYFQNSNLSAQVASLGGQSAGVTAQIASLSGQVQALDASNTALAASVASLTAQNLDLATNLSFAALPELVSGATTTTVSISGHLTGGKSSFALTTTYGVVIYVSNAKDAKVIAALNPLLTSTSPVTLAGTHTAGSQYLSVTAVNGAPLQ